MKAKKKNELAEFDIIFYSKWKHVSQALKWSFASIDAHTYCTKSSADSTLDDYYHFDTRQRLRVCASCVSIDAAGLSHSIGSSFADHTAHNHLTHLRLFAAITYTPRALNANAANTVYHHWQSHKNYQRSWSWLDIFRSERMPSIVVRLRMFVHIFYATYRW